MFDTDNESLLCQTAIFLGITDCCCVSKKIFFNFCLFFCQAKESVNDLRIFNFSNVNYLFVDLGFSHRIIGGLYHQWVQHIREIIPVVCIIL